MAQYYRLPNLLRRLNQKDNAMSELLMGYGKDVDSFINVELRRHLGEKDAAGNDIILPLTASTVPPIDTSLQKHADDLVIAYLRADQSEDKEIRDKSEEKFKREYLIGRFGYSRDLPYDFEGLANIT